MPGRSTIEWTEKTWNPVTGCTKTSPGCRHCYAERMARRLQGMGHPSYAGGFTPTWHDRLAETPLHWRAPQLVFVNSMGDLFHECVPVEFVGRVFDVMRRAHWHQFQVLTKRSQRALELAPSLEWPPNVWMGVSVETEAYQYRIDHLRQIPAHLRFLSLEPLLGPLPALDLAGIGWVIVGGESGPGARRMDPAWVTRIRDQCAWVGVPFFFKQWGGFRKRDSGRLLEGRTWDGHPAGTVAASRGAAASSHRPVAAGRPAMGSCAADSRTPVPTDHRPWGPAQRRLPSLRWPFRSRHCCCMVRSPASRPVAG
ncbi:MAG: phage Gp37/Gp68 family protein [Candidatus Latescibacterota bacterium]